MITSDNIIPQLDKMLVNLIVTTSMMMMMVTVKMMITMIKSPDEDKTVMAAKNDRSTSLRFKLCIENPTDL